MKLEVWHPAALRAIIGRDLTDAEMSEWNRKATAMNIWEAYENHPDIEKAREVFKRVRALAHAMQSGVAMMMNYPESTKETDPKHLRVGVNNAMVEGSALQMLLVKKGIISPLEFAEAVEFLMQREVNGYREQIAAHLGTTPDKIKLG